MKTRTFCRFRMSIPTVDLYNYKIRTQQFILYYIGTQRRLQVLYDHIKQLHQKQ